MPVIIGIREKLGDVRGKSLEFVSHVIEYHSLSANIFRFIEDSCVEKTSTKNSRLNSLYTIVEYLWLNIPFVLTIEKI